MSETSIEPHAKFPTFCSECGRRNQYWVDGTYGCSAGHIYAYTNDSIIWWKTVDGVRKMGDSKEAEGDGSVC